MNKLWSDRAWDDYLYWQSQDKKTLKRINQGKANNALPVFEFNHRYIQFTATFMSMEPLNCEL